MVYVAIVAIDAGTRVGKYTVQRLLGKGGFGMVFLARDEMLGRACALKFLLQEHTARPGVLARFLNEARAAAGIDHPGIVTVFECGVVEHAGPGVDGTAYIAMELLKGASLGTRLAAGPLAVEHALAVVDQVASAVGAAHAAGIIHRDLKPDNIFLVPDPVAATGERVKVLDFGIAKLVDTQHSSSGATPTSTHMIFGTPRYMSPEQCRSTARVDERSDVYALGCILYEMVCGVPPYDGDMGLLIAMHQMGPVPRASALRPDLPPSIDDAIARMLAKDPADRPASMSAVRELLGGRPSVRTPAVRPPAAPAVSP
ncbi:MAG: serine/threonine protein kinase, partial [Deltaproteobacteria bacterium]|nr:serine/threonine protein kinase [Deltaproteobacteria bacterium]